MNADNTAADLADAMLANVKGLTSLLEHLAARSPGMALPAPEVFATPRPGRNPSEKP